MTVRYARWIALFLAPTLLFFLAFYAYPIITVFISSFADWRLASSMSFVGFDNYASLGTDADFAAGLAHTLLWLVIHWVVYVGMGLAVAVMTANGSRFSRFVRTAYLLPNMIPIAALAFLFYFIFNPSIGPINGFLEAVGLERWALNWYQDTRTAFLTVTLTSVLYGGILCLLFAAEISAIPAEVYESAKIDGSSELRTAFSITLPLLRNMIGTAMILTTVHVLKSFEIIYLTTVGGPGNDTVNLPILIFRMAMNNNNLGYSNTIAVVTIVIGVVSIAMISRAFRMGTSYQ
ncbi:sugar ABC transporter permease [Paenibacillus sp.]|uniref:carbohydrate ABC transporter permease n=1 Tax=Paenibacillus sp. TaxID=58172 RepID=UPI002D28BF94|nr:sugar ABC transporter permease [Paenibacillus sp.]HZG87770.1 sugar ABC transporter permease [Paenibacillus sp.]